MTTREVKMPYKWQKSIFSTLLEKLLKVTEQEQDGSVSQAQPSLVDLINTQFPLCQKLCLDYTVADTDWRQHKLTNFRRQTFSLKAPMQPVNPRINMIPPVMISAKAGSITMSLKKP